MPRIAWADGKLQRAEHDLIVRTAEQMGWLEGKGEEVLERWLTAPPFDEEVELGMELIKYMASTSGETPDD